MQVAHTRYGQLICSPNDVYIGRGLIEYGEFSEAEVEFFRQVITSDSVVCDIGANIGAHTLAFARLARHVYAFEPHPTMYLALCGMVALNELRNVTTVHAGCGSRQGVMCYAPIDTTRLDNFGAHPLIPFAADKPQARIARLTQPCDFLKIDVEGMELDVLRGAAEMIRQCKPLMYIEADRADKFAALRDYIKELGYFPYWHKPPLFNRNNFNARTDNIWEDDLLGSMNLICSPKAMSNLGPEATQFPSDFTKQDVYKMLKSVA